MCEGSRKSDRSLPIVRLSRAGGGASPKFSKYVPALEQTQPKYLRRVVVTTASPGRMSCEFLQRICRLLAKPFDIDELVLIVKECAQPDGGMTVPSASGAV